MTTSVGRLASRHSSAERFTPPMKLPLRRTPKASGDHVIINPALKAWLERKVSNDTE